MQSNRILVAGAGGFIGGHLVAELLRRGHDDVLAVDVKPLDQWYQVFPQVENEVADLKELYACRAACAGVSEVYNLAADMGGMGFIENNKALCMLSVLINTHLLQAAHEAGAERFFYASSACVYAADKQKNADVTPLAEGDAYPAMPEDGYGWEKLFSERMCRHFREDFGLATRVARFHNVYGPEGTWDGGREKAPAAISRKVAAAKATGDREIPVWGDGTQTRSFMYIDDCVEGILKIMHSDIEEPINLGSDELITIDGLTELVADLAGIDVTLRHQLDKPRGVNGRNSDNTLIERRLGWAPSISLREGMAKTYDWVEAQYLAKHAAADSAAAELAGAA
ncbi:NAD-dependent epimerase/dehydratase family protein [Alienimonas chondri]|uniref:GDP-L-fucose synthase n=1 Tax=Alienimonas chondri TaxID=2681879 RepID=A0ABX1VK25_9PLAN|nr:NAD-dependent epimerase/dehydratase family protein [Alienimonas chondri]NNJ27771.1 GDP-L-fucose synthase [Alienimonas chondri]